MADTLKWLYRLINTFIEGSSAIFASLQMTFSEIIKSNTSDDPFSNVIREVLDFIINVLGLGDVTLIGFVYGSGFAFFLILMLVRWVRKLM